MAFRRLKEFSTINRRFITLLIFLALLTSATKAPVTAQTVDEVARQAPQWPVIAGEGDKEQGRRSRRISARHKESKEVYWGSKGVGMRTQGAPATELEGLNAAVQTAGESFYTRRSGKRILGKGRDREGRHRTPLSSSVYLKLQLTARL